MAAEFSVTIRNRYFTDSIVIFFPCACALRVCACYSSLLFYLCTRGTHPPSLFTFFDVGVLFFVVSCLFRVFSCVFPVCALCVSVCHTGRVAAVRDGREGRARAQTISMLRKFGDS